MSVLVYGMSVPRSCDECELRDSTNTRCRVLDCDVSGLGKRLDCPITKVPDNCNFVERNECLKAICSNCYPDSGKVGCPITCYEYDRIMELPVISIPLKEEGAMTWYKNSHYTTAGIKETKPVTEQKHGMWKEEFDNITNRFNYVCSVCGRPRSGISEWNYCPDCGALMDMRKDGRSK